MAPPNKKAERRFGYAMFSLIFVVGVNSPSRRGKIFLRSEATLEQGSYG
jgi:hypothetical protein